MAKNKSFVLVVVVIIAVAGLIYLFMDDFTTRQNSSSQPLPTAGATKQDEDTPYASEGYRLVFGQSFNRALASQDDLGISILIAVDCSGSMQEAPKASNDGKEKYVVASESLTGVIDFIENFYVTNIKKQDIRLRLGLLRFNNNVKILFELKDMNAKAFADLKDITSNPASFNPGGQTAIGSTLLTGAEILAQSGTIFKSLIVISDGQNTTGDMPDQVLKAIVENRNNKSSKDFPVLTNSILVSFIGFDVDTGIFSGLNDLGSRITNAADKAGLKQSLESLFLADITKLEAKGK
jgi:hypothetical protein